MHLRSSVYLTTLFFFGVLFGIFSYECFQSNKIISAIVFSILCLLMLLFQGQHIKKIKNNLHQLLTALNYEDFSISPLKKQSNELKQQAVDLFYKHKQKNIDTISYKILYQNILNHLDIGLMILKKTDKHWQVFYSNPKFIEILQIPKFDKWSYYEDKIPDFFNLIEQTNYLDSQNFFDVSINDSIKKTYSLRTTRMQTLKNDFYILSLESVQRIIERKEKMAWNNLMKVISHELLNSLTPINSLIQNMVYVTNQKQISVEDKNELSESLTIINNKLKQLLQFVNNYRQIAQLPKPNFKKIFVENISSKVIRLLKNEFEEKNVTLICEIKNLEIRADEKMVEQSLINLLLNALHAVESTENAQIKIKAFSKENRAVILVEDNGIGIEKDISNKIFLPFFTTRINGSGIGLTLTKNMMESQDGYINFKTKKNGSVFELWFLK